MSSMATIGTCIYCLKIRSVTMTKGPQMVPGRREGICAECQKLSPAQREKLRNVRSKRPSAAEKFRQEYPR